MDYTDEHLSERLSVLGITATDDDIRYLQRALEIIADGEKRLAAFPDLADTKIMLTMDMKELTLD